MKLDQYRLEDLPIIKKMIAEGLITMKPMTPPTGQIFKLKIYKK